MPSIADMPKGIDVSKFQGNVDWNRVKDAGISFAFARAVDDPSLTLTGEVAGQLIEPGDHLRPGPGQPQARRPR